MNPAPTHTPMALQTPRGGRRACLCTLGAMVLWSLAGCQTGPNPAVVPSLAAERPTGFTDAQLRVLKAEGFHPTDEGWELGLNVKILFDVDTDLVQDGARPVIVRLGQQLRSVGIEKLRVEGHTDPTGTRAHNERLSLKRARAVGLLLVQAGFDSANVDLRGLGSRFPIQSNDTAEGRSENRRVALVVVPQP